MVIFFLDSMQILVLLLLLSLLLNMLIGLCYIVRW